MTASGSETSVTNSDSSLHPDRARAGDCSTVDQVQAASSKCTLCRLSNDRTCVVTGEGHAGASVFCVVEAPGYHEDHEGQLFLGATGRFFDSLLSTASLQRSDIYISSVVKCRPPRNRSPFPDEISACEGWLFRELALVNPDLIITFGATPLRLITGQRHDLVDVHGSPITQTMNDRQRTVLPLYHPAAALHVERLQHDLRAAMRSIPALLKQKATTGQLAQPSEVEVDPAAREAPQQLQTEMQMSLDVESADQVAGTS